jgi:hypothetical protein
MRSIILSVITLGLFSASPVFARYEYFMNFEAKYPKAKALQRCTLCHGSEGFTDYGMEFAMSEYNFDAIEPLDSDGDTASNIEEINRVTDPSFKDDVPASGQAQYSCWVQPWTKASFFGNCSLWATSVYDWIQLRVNSLELCMARAHDWLGQMVKNPDPTVEKPGVCRVDEVKLEFYTTEYRVRASVEKK